MPLEGTLEADMRRRDLTINALAEDRDGHLYGHPDALSDLRGGILRPASPTSFRDEPVRVFRLARMACELPSFTIHPAAVEQMRAVAEAGLLERIPAERIGRELMKALASPKPSRWLAVLAEGRCLSPWFRELETAMDIPAGPIAYHSGSVMEHLMDVMDTVAGDPLCVWMSLCHDLGKIGTDPTLLPHHYGHELRGTEPAGHLAQRFALPSRYVAAGVLSSQLHMKAGIYEMLRAGTRCDLLMQIHNAGLDEPFWKLAEADSGRSLRPVVNDDLAVLLGISLPPEWRDRGRESGKRLRAMRCQALAIHMAKRKRGEVDD